MLVDYVPVADLTNRAEMIARQKEIRRRQEEAARHVPVEREPAPVSHEAIAVIAPVKQSLPDPLAHLPRSIIRRVAAQYGVTYAEVVGRDKFDHIVCARRAAILAVREAHPGYSLLKLGRIFGGRDHTTIIHALRDKAPLHIGRLNADAPSPSEIISRIAEKYSIPAWEITGRFSRENTIAARWEAAYTIHTSHPDLTFRQLCALFDGRCAERLRMGIRRHRDLLKGGVAA
jgi:chromosomal replication initiation ATPase DnaA